MTSESEVKKNMLIERSSSLSKERLREFAGSLDLALEVIIKGDTQNLHYTESEDLITDAILEPGEFWLTCQAAAWEKFGCIDINNYSIALLVKLHALEIGRKSLIQAYLDNHPYEDLF